MATPTDQVQIARDNLAAVEAWTPVTVGDHALKDTNVRQLRTWLSNNSAPSPTHPSHGATPA